MSTLSGRLDIIFFDAIHGEVYQSLAQKHYGKGPAGFIFYATTTDYLTTITERTPGRWSLLLIEESLALGGDNAVVLSRFADQNPLALICVERTSGIELPVMAFPVHRQWKSPSNRSEWLQMMDTLLAEADQRRAQ